MDEYFEPSYGRHFLPCFLLFSYLPKFYVRNLSGSSLLRVLEYKEQKRGLGDRDWCLVFLGQVRKLKGNCCVFPQPPGKKVFIYAFVREHYWRLNALPKFAYVKLVYKRIAKHRHYRPWIILRVFTTVGLFSNIALSGSDF